MLETIPVNQLLEESLAIKSVLAERFGITLETRLEDPCASLHGDRRLLRAALGNLIDDAIRTNRLGSKVLIQQHMSGDGVVISVTSPGDGDLGLDPTSVKEVLLEQQAVLDGKGNKPQIGMSLARRIADLHGGRIRVCNTEGEGSTYMLHLPLRERGEALYPAS